MSMDQRDLLRRGAEQRLKELDSERDDLIALIQTLLDPPKDDGADLTPKDSPLTGVAGIPPKKLHWTQRPENAAKVMAMARRGSRTRRRNSKRRK